MPGRTSDRQPLDPREDILAYLQANPDAADSIEGIIDWWLPMRFHTARADIERALRGLVSKGVIEEVDCGAGRLLYRLFSIVKPEPTRTTSSPKTTFNL